MEWKSGVKSGVMLIKLMDRNSSLTFSIIILVTALYLTQTAYAEEHTEDENRYGSSEFNGSSFGDTSFRKTDYKELRSTNPAAAQLVRENTEPKEGSRLLQKHPENRGVSDAGSSADKGPIKNPSGYVISEERSAPVRDLPGDWVPNKLDPTCNGGFEVAPDNGSPVPYRLNGHVDIQRGRP